MQYQQVTQGIFLQRPNRFIAKVEIAGREELVHVKNTGRCKELLQAGCRVYLSQADNPARKTRYDLVAVEKQREGQSPLLKKGNLFSGEAVILREKSYGNSRFDFLICDGAQKAFLEVKGVTLEKDGIAWFPDAPTERGVKHIRELIRCQQEGYAAYLLFVIQMKDVTAFRPNDATHPAFGAALRAAQQAGVHVLAMDCLVTADSMTLDAPVPVQLGRLNSATQPADSVPVDILAADRYPDSHGAD
jgi:sugar fermentation stimulation protein A